MPVRIAISGNREVEFSDYTFIQMDKYMKQRYPSFQTSDLIDMIRSPKYSVIVTYDHKYLRDGSGNIIDCYRYQKEVWIYKLSSHYNDVDVKVCPIFPDPFTGNCFNLFITMDVTGEEEEKCRLEEWISTLTPLSLQSGNYSEKKSGDKKCEFCYR